MIGKDLIERLVVVDTETTGQNPFVHDVISVGLVGVASGVSLEVNVNLPMDVVWTDYGLKNFERFRSLHSKSAISPANAILEIEEFISRNFGDETITFVGHNMAFDRFFLAKLAHRAGVSEIRRVSHRTIDTYSLLALLRMMGRIPADATTSSGAFKYFNVGVPVESRHTALGDAMATRSLFFKIVSKFLESSDLLEYASNPLAD